MELKKVIDFNMDQNCYVLKSGEYTVVIDPGSNKILSEVDKADVILLTHSHYDHTSAVLKLKEKTGAMVVAGKYCVENLKEPSKNVSLMFGETFSADCVDKVLSDGEVLKIGDMEIKCMETPGHTSCSVCYLIDDNLFSGDTLFLRTTGRWDLPTGDFKVLENSIKNKIYTLDENIKVYPGHGNETSVGYEKKFNMVIEGRNKSEEELN